MYAPQQLLVSRAGLVQCTVAPELQRHSGCPIVMWVHRVAAQACPAVRERQRDHSVLCATTRTCQILGFATMKIHGQELEMEYRDEFGKKVFSYTQQQRAKRQLASGGHDGRDAREARASESVQ